MAAQDVRIVTATATMQNYEDVIVFNSAAAIDFQLLPAVGDGREFLLKNIGAGAVTLLPDGDDLIEGATSLTLYTGESQILVDYLAEGWIVTSDAPGEITKGFYVDANRSDAFAGNGSIDKPYSTIALALAAATVDAADHIAASTYTKACYVIRVAPGTYSDNLAIGNFKSLRFVCEAGVYITGNITYTTTMVGGTADNYYSRLEFAGTTGNRPDKGPAVRISGTITGTRNNDSLTYVSLSGVHCTGNIAFNTNGTWVVYADNCRLAGRLSAGDSAIVLLETARQTNISGAIAAAADGTSVTAISLYNCYDSAFGLINISNPESCRIVNCTFSAAVTITAKTVSIDASSYKNLIAQTETLTGTTLSHLDNIGENPVPVARTTGAITAAGTVNANISSIDTGIGTDAQMPDSSINVDHDLTIFQNLRSLDTYKSVRTVKVKVGNIGVAGSDLFFASAADANEQPIDLGEILPAKCRLMDVMVFTDSAFTNLGALTTDVGLTTGAGDIIGAANNTAASAVMATPNAGAFLALPIATAQHVWLNVKPTNNWNSVNPVGRMSVYVTFIDLTNV